MGWNTGTKSFTASGAVGTSDSSGVARPVVVWDLALISGNSSNAVILYNGTSTSADPVLAASVSSVGVLDAHNFIATNGLYCPKGCYLSMSTASASTATVSFHEEF